ncbi:MAG: carboxylating nicotinate-nucleotide diphosphorylase [Candidatus Margulisiibacteriota bacterium]
MDQKQLIKLALLEDTGKGDITSGSTIPASLPCEAIIISKEAGILAGLAAARDVFKLAGEKISFSSKLKDGQRLKKGTIIASIKGPARQVLAAERTALNFLQKLSGIATQTSKFSKKITGTGTVLLDTRKTTPLLRKLEKDAVVRGGGVNHRLGLYDSILIKDNHIALIKDIGAAVKASKKFGQVEIEAKNISEVKKFLLAGADRILLDNMDLKTLKESVKIIKKWNKGNKNTVKTEASGGIDLNNISSVAKTGVDFISVGALTHSAQALDISLRITKNPSLSLVRSKRLR